jgi:hypothetical protein
MTWEIEFDDSFALELSAFTEDVQDSLLAVAKLLAEYGPQLGRPHADTLKGSTHPNMKEVRFEGDGGEWRAAFAFDPERKAIFLAAGDKAGVNEKRFYKQLIAKADARFSAHIATLKAAKKGKMK